MTDPKSICPDCGRPTCYCGCDELEEELSPEEEAWENCGQFVDAGYIVCSAFASEDCDSCPFYNEIGTRA